MVESLTQTITPILKDKHHGRTGFFSQQAVEEPGRTVKEERGWRGGGVGRFKVEEKELLLLSRWCLLFVTGMIFDNRNG